MTIHPLLAPGLHDVPESDLEQRFLVAFPTSATRATLLAGLRTYLTLLRSVGMPLEVWVDGSFCTSKVDPNDVDVVVFADSAMLNSLDTTKQQKLAMLVDRDSSRAAFGCDVLFALQDDVNMRSYWRGWYGFDRNEQPKGIAKIAVIP